MTVHSGADYRHLGVARIGELSECERFVTHPLVEVFQHRRTRKLVYVPSEQRGQETVDFYPVKLGELILPPGGLPGLK